MGNRAGRHEPPVARVRTGRDSPGREWETGWDGPEEEWEEGWDDPEREWEEGWDSPEGKWKTGRDRQAAAGYGNNRRKRERKRSGSRNAGAGVRHAAVSVLLTAVVLVSVGAVGFLVLQIVGKNRLYGSVSSEELVVRLSDAAVAFGGSTESGGEEDWQPGDVRYEGIHYRYNQDILTFLFLGIDRMEEVQPVKNGMDGGQSDAIFLLVLDPHKKEAAVIGVPRDTMTDVDIYTATGTLMGTARTQICLQHGYGDGAALSCERSVKAVSGLFYGLPVHGYCAINMGAIPLLNDAVGGIRLQSLETLDFKEFHAEEGEELYLQGMDAYYYLHNRDTSSFNSAGRRLQRQKQYLTEYAAAVMEALKEDITLPVSLYGTLSRYMVTDISVDEVGYLATQAAGYSLGEIYTLEGETVMGERFEEFHPDEEALYRLILEVFYEEV